MPNIVPVKCLLFPDLAHEQLLWHAQGHKLGCYITPPYAIWIGGYF